MTHCILAAHRLGIPSFVADTFDASFAQDVASQKEQQLGVEGGDGGDCGGRGGEYGGGGGDGGKKSTTGIEMSFRA